MATVSDSHMWLNVTACVYEAGEDAVQRDFLLWAFNLEWPDSSFTTSPHKIWCDWDYNDYTVSPHLNGRPLNHLNAVRLCQRIKLNQSTGALLTEKG